MKPQVVLVALAVAVVVLAALPLGHGIGERAEAATTASAWPCCDSSCSVCTRSLPPKCRCADSSPKGCHPACKKCVKSSDDDGSNVVFHCADMITDFCKRRCTPKARLDA
ncbi:unnamed protein product [Urochloa humidicola]